MYMHTPENNEDFTWKIMHLVPFSKQGPYVRGRLFLNMKLRPYNLNDITTTFVTQRLRR